MSWLKKLRMLISFKDHADKLIALLKGKKTVIGAVSMLLWFVIYGVPVFFPQYSFLVEIALKIQEFLASYGMELDTELLGAGAGITAIGLLDKLRRMFYPDGKN